MKIHRPKYGKDPKTGKPKEWDRYRIDFTDRRQRPPRRCRLTGFTSELATARAADKIEKLLEATGPLSADVVEWLERIPWTMRRSLEAYGVIPKMKGQAAAGKRLSADGEDEEAGHLEDWRESLLAKGTTAKQANLVYTRVRTVFGGCGFAVSTDIVATVVEAYLRDRRDRTGGVSQQTFNFYVQAVKQFCRWMVENNRATVSPLAHLRRMKVTERRHERRELTIEERTSLLTATRAAETRCGMSGQERYLLYRLAMETGLRAGECRSLRVLSLDFKALTVTVEGAYTKNRQRAVLPLLAATAEELKVLAAGWLPQCRLFPAVPDYKIAPMLREDLEDAGVDYEVDGKYADFHSLRHTFISSVVRSGATVKEAQALARHSTAALTIGIYSHVGINDTRRVVERLQTVAVAAVKTGTDDGQAKQDNTSHVRSVCQNQTRTTTRVDSNSGFQNENAGRRVETGVSHGLQNRCGAEKVPGGFDSHSPPPFSDAAFALRTRIICCLVLLTCAFVSAAFAQAVNDRPTLRAGFARVEITCPLGIPLIGSYGKPSDAILDPLYARSMVLNDGANTVAIVSVDLLYAPMEEIVAPVRALIKARCGIPEQNILICATHTHSGPEVFTRSKIPSEDRLDPSRIDQAYLHALRERLADCVCAAHANLAPAAIGFARGHLPEVVFNRRPIGPDGKAKMTLNVTPDIAATRTIRTDAEGNTRTAFARLEQESGLQFGPVDPDLCVLRAEDPAGNIMGSIINFGCHPVCIYPSAPTTISADYPGDAAALVEQVEGGTCLFTLAPAGNLVPYQRGQAGHAKIGKAVGAEAIRRLQFLQAAPNVPLAALAKQIELPLKETGTPVPGPCIKTEIQVLRIGDIHILGLPGEILVEIGLEIKRKAGIEKLILISLSNDAIGYVCPAKAYDEGGYEPGSGTLLAKGSAEILITEALDLMARMKTR